MLYQLMKGKSRSTVTFTATAALKTLKSKGESIKKHVQSDHEKKIKI